MAKTWGLDKLNITHMDELFTFLASSFFFPSLALGPVSVFLW